MTQRSQFRPDSPSYNRISKVQTDQCVPLRVRINQHALGICPKIGLAVELKSIHAHQKRQRPTFEAGAKASGATKTENGILPASSARSPDMPPELISWESYKSEALERLQRGRDGLGAMKGHRYHDKVPRGIEAAATEPSLTTERR